MNGTNLQNANLSEANLQNAKLFVANLQNANLSEANLQNANLLAANLQNASLYRANLQNASLYRTNLQNANLIRSDLPWEKLRGIICYQIFTDSNITENDFKDKIYPKWKAKTDSKWGALTEGERMTAMQEFHSETGMYIFDESGSQIIP